MHDSAVKRVGSPEETTLIFRLVSVNGGKDGQSGENAHGCDDDQHQEAAEDGEQEHRIGAT